MYDRFLFLGIGPFSYFLLLELVFNDAEEIIELVVFLFNDCGIDREEVFVQVLVGEFHLVFIDFR